MRVLGGAEVGTEATRSLYSPIHSAAPDELLVHFFR
jgi:hypothetical protein